MEIAAVDLPAKILWGKIQYVGIVFTPLLWFVFIFNHTHKDRRLHNSTRVLINIIPFVTLALSLTTEQHKLIWNTIELFKSGDFSALKVSYGAWFWVHTAYSYGLIVAGTVYVLRSLSKKGGMYRGQAAALLVAVLSPWLGNILYLGRISPIPHLDLTPFAFAISLVAMTWAILGFGLINLSPFARDFVIENMGDGVIVFDAEDRVTDINASGLALRLQFPNLEIGKKAREVFAAQAQLLEDYRAGTERLGEIRFGEGQDRWYDLRLSLLRDRKQEVIGKVLLVHDISARKKAEERLSQLYRAVDASPSSIVITNTDGIIDYVNPKFTQVTGYSAEEVIGQNPRILKTELTPRETHVQMWSTITSGKEWHGEFCNRKKNGEYYWELASISPIEDALGSISHYVAVKEDITEERFLRDRLHKQNEYLSILHVVTLDLLNRRNLDDLLSAIVIRAAALLNAPYVEILLKEDEHLVLRACTQVHLLPIGTWLDRAEAEFSWQAHDTGKPVILNNYSSWQNKHDGYTALKIGAAAVLPVMVGDACIAVLGVGRTLKDQTFTDEEMQIGQLFARLVSLVLDNVNLYSSALEEIAERKRSQTLLQESETRYRQIVENASDLIYRLDLQGNFEYVNPPILHLLGYPYEQALLGKHVSELVDAEYRHDFNAFYERQVGENILTTYYEFPTVIPGERPTWLGQNVQLIREGDRVVGLQAVARNITERKQAEFSMALARDQAVEASQFKSQLLAKVSHELRTPLGAILGFSELMSSGTFGPLNEEQKDAADQIVESVHFLDDLVNELLDEAQISAQKMVLRLEPLSVSVLRERVETNMNILARRKSLHLSFTVAADLPEIIYGDEARLQQVMVNLIGNAVKFTREGGVHVELCRQDANRWIVQVSDTGVGIPKESLETIFEPFRQVINSNYHATRGTGLGLTITKQLVELMGGKIIVDSEIGKGSVFTVYLPLIDNLEKPRVKTVRFDR